MQKTRSHASLSIANSIGVSVATSTVCTLIILAGLSFRSQLSANLGSPFNQNSGSTTDEDETDNDYEDSTNSSQSNTGSTGQSGTSGTSGTSGATGECILQINKCSPTDVGCMEAAVFLKVDCKDSRCNDVQNICRAINIEKTEDQEDDEDDKNEESKKGKETVETITNSHTNSLQESSEERDTHSGSNNDERTDTSERDHSDKQQLGCYTTKGEWTTDRSACAATVRKMPTNTQQQPFITDDDTSTTPSATNTSPSTFDQSAHREIEIDQQDNDLQNGFQELFNTSTGPSAATTNLLAAATSALERLQTIAGTPLPDTTRAMVADTRTWIATLITDVSSGQPSDDDVQAKADELKAKLTETMQLVSATIPTGTKRPDSVLKTMDHIFATLPVVFAFLQEQSAPISLDSSTVYMTTSNAYTKAKADCLATASKCAKLQDIITGLESLRLSMTVTLEQLGKTDLQARVDEMMR